jgi:hypothetical protein
MRGEKEYLKRYQPSKEQAGETAGSPAVNAQRHLSINENEIGTGNEIPCRKRLGTKKERQENGLRKAGGDAPPEIQSGGEIILMAEDEPAVRSVLLEILRMEGYVVMEANDGEEAIKVFLANQDAIDLVILDEGMPRKSGLEAAKKPEA